MEESKIFTASSPYSGMGTFQGSPQEVGTSASGAPSTLAMEENIQTLWVSRGETTISEIVVSGFRCSGNQTTGSGRNAGEEIEKVSAMQVRQDRQAMIPQVKPVVNQFL